ncbi:MAG: helix-turn-helix transcriptional regulator [Bacteroidota bacterium]
MTLGQRVADLRKRMKVSQNELGKRVGTSGDIIGRYERDEVKPSIEVAAKIADELDTSLDFLMGKTDVELDQAIIKRVVEIQSLPDEDRTHILYTLDGLLQNVRTRMAFAK